MAMAGFDTAVWDARAIGKFGALKLRLGYPTLAEDIAAVRAVRTRIGKPRVMIDYDQTLSLPDALERRRALHPHVVASLSGSQRALALRHADLPFPRIRRLGKRPAVGPLAIVDGHAVTPERSGNGLVWDEAAVEHCRLR